MGIQSLRAASGAPLEQYVEWGQSEDEVCLRTGIDPDRRYVCLATGGVWGIADVDRFFAVQKRIHDIARERYGRLDLLMDLRQASVVTQATSARMQELNERLYRSDDRVAILCDSALMKMQLRRAFAIGTRQVFDNWQEAEVWLLSPPR